MIKANDNMFNFKRLLSYEEFSRHTRHTESSTQGHCSHKLAYSNTPKRLSRANKHIAALLSADSALFENIICFKVSTMTAGSFN